MDVWVDGLNYYFVIYLDVYLEVIIYFELWMVLFFIEGSIGGDIEWVEFKQFKDFYGEFVDVLLVIVEMKLSWVELIGFNGIVIVLKFIVDGYVLLLINLYILFFFCFELQMISDEGLDVYGVVIWGQFFIYQGFN